MKAAITDAGTFGSVKEFMKWVEANHGTPAGLERDATRQPHSENGWAVFKPAGTYRIRTAQGDIFEATINDGPKEAA